MKLTKVVEFGDQQLPTNLRLVAESEADGKLLERLADWLRASPAVNLTHLLDLLDGAAVERGAA